MAPATGINALILTLIRDGKEDTDMCRFLMELNTCLARVDETGEGGSVLRGLIADAEAEITPCAT